METRTGRHRRRLAPVVGAAVLAMLATVLVACSPAQAVTLEEKGAPGQDAFTESVASTAPDAFPETVVAQLAEMDAGFDKGGATGRVAPAVTPGLYGVSDSVAPCDVERLLPAITADESLASAWADVVGIAADGIPTFLGGLTPVLLTVDTLVTNHGYSSGRAIPRASVLEAGTAVLVDRTGVPTVRCACGNPLLPARDGVALSEATGSAWVGYSADSVVTVAPGSAMTSFRLTDVNTGALVDRRAGSNLGELLIVTTVEGGLTTIETEGAVYTSRDGEDWTQVLASGRRLDDVAATDDLAVAVGRDASGGGIVHTSTTGTEWEPAVTVADPLGAVGFGDGRWLAAGSGGGGAVVYASTDGSSWSRIGAAAPPRGGDGLAPMSIAYGFGTWAMVALECHYRVCEHALLTSADDGATWTNYPLADTVFDLSIAHDGVVWGALGAEDNPNSTFRDMASLGADSLGIGATSDDPVAWTFSPTEPSRGWLQALAPGLTDWLALDIMPFGSQPPPAANGIHRSTDVITWARAGTTPAGATAVAVLRSFR